MNRLWRCVLTIGVIGFLSVGPALKNAWAQQQLGTIQGTIVDPAGALVVGATVTATNKDTRETRTVVSNESGFYRIVNLPPGRYDVSVEAQGFRKALRTDVVLFVGATLGLNFELEPGVLEEVIEVTASIAQLQTEKADVSAVVERKKIVELPLQLRNVFQLAALQPGITGLATGADFLTPEYGIGVNANGQRGSGNNASLDGASINGNPWGGTVLIIPNVESVQEFQVITNNPSAEYGRNSGAIISIVTKSGTNEFHGSLFFFHRNDNLRALNIFARGALRRDATKEERQRVAPEFRRNDFGYSLGGPIRRDKTFFFTSYEGLRAATGQAFVTTVETKEFVDFVLRTRPNSIAAYLLKNFPPLAYPTTGLRDLGSPVPGATQIGPPDGIPDVGSVTVAPSGVRNGDQFNIRIDHLLFGGNGRLRGTYYRTKLDPVDVAVRPKFRQPFPHRNQFLNLAYTHIISPRTVNEFSFGYLRMYGRAPDLNPESPTITISGLGAGFGTAFWMPIRFAQNVFEYKDTLTMNRGNHGLKAGFEIRRVQDNHDFHHWRRPNYTFNSILNFANDEPLTEVRAVDPMTGLETGIGAGYRNFEFAAFIQDDWKVRRNFTLNLGLRYENFGTPSKVGWKFQNIIYAPGRNVFERIANARMAYVDQLYKSDNNNFAPRFGFAWDITGKGKLVLRGGTGISYNRLNNTVYTDEKMNPPRFAAASTDVRTPGAPPIVYTLGPKYPPNPALARGLDERGGIRGTRVNLRVVDPNITTPYAQNWFLGIQRELPGGLVAEVNYIGSVGRHLHTGDGPGGENYNRFAGDLLDGRLDRLNPSFGIISLGETGASSSFHGGTIQVSRRYSQGFAFQAAFTFGKVLETPGAAMEVTRRDLDRSVTGFHRGKKLSINAIWEIPFWRERPVVRHILGGWQLNAIVQIQSGAPFSVFHGAAYPRGDFNADGQTGDRPHTPSWGNTKRNLSRSDFLRGIFTVADFPLPAPGTLGNLGRNTFRGPWYASTDLSLFKNFRVTETASVQFRAEFFNAFNRVNLGTPVADLNSTLFGRSTGVVGDPRDIQLALKILF
ncbi:MAG: TonB-dependent receptor [Blastocatellia bacterium]|nr:TonB-dependent receptor [Blastocatellia bacterium]MCS7157215.1 TonB-dependent receptor [Blastocatellia bacterium]MCX7752322.1 TonB-dependent receptor [Blastocatellia bacterium]MDW8167203.1 TonB-dependent receptor [Acidobacteriota bacterium]